MGKSAMYKIKIMSVKNDKCILFSQFNTQMVDNFSGSCCLTIDKFDYGNLDKEIDKFINLIEIPGLKELTIFSSDIDVFKIFELIRERSDKKFELNYFLEKSNQVNLEKIREFCNLKNSNKKLSYEYIMHIKNDESNINLSYFSVFGRNDSYLYYASNGENSITLHPSSFKGISDLQKKIYQIIDEIFKGINIDELSDLDKSILVSNYIQNNIQYIEGKSSFGDNKEYICEKIINKNGESHYLINLLNGNNYGVCGPISLLTVLLLDNPIVKCNCQFIDAGMFSGHYFTTQIIDGKEYIIDNTWNITRNKDKYDGSLKARSFSYDYLLIGQDKLNESEDIANHHIPQTKYLYPIEFESIPKEKIQASIEKLTRMGVKFDNYKPPIYEQYIVEKDKTI